MSIARRLQDPLAELVKIDPKSIGVGQYQHDVSEAKLSRSLDAVVEDCVNAVGVDVNTASRAAADAGCRASASGLAENIVPPPRRATAVPDPQGAEGGAPARPEGVRAVRRLPAHPRRRRPARRLGRAPRGLSGGAAHPGDATGRRHPRADRQQRRARSALGPTDFVDDRRSACRPSPTSSRELEKPGRDPRPAFKTATFAEGVEKIGDLEPGMVLEGVVTNVAAFGAFVDVGVHQDGLVHVSAMSTTFVKDPREVVKPGDVVKVKVLDVDVGRKRISLTLRLDDRPGEQRRRSR